MAGKSGKQMKTFKPNADAVSSAQVSGPAQPPEIMTESFGSDFTSDSIDFLDLDFLDPTIPMFMVENSPIKNVKASLVHHKFSFIGCFSCKRKDNIDYLAFRKWKSDCNLEKTEEISNILTGYIDNYYDFITTAPPSKSRDFDNYCCFRLCESISNKTGIPFIKTFRQRSKKSRHGWHSSLEAEMPEVLDGWSYRNKSILFIDDFITSGITAKNCYSVLRSFDNHVDGLIYCKY